MHTHLLSSTTAIAPSHVGHALCTSEKRRTLYPETLSDEALLESVRLYGDNEAFSLLFQRYHTRLCSFVYSLVSCRQTTEEIVSDVFVKVWNNRETLRIQSSLKAYLLVSVRNQTIDYLRRQQRRRTVSTEEAYIHLPDPDKGAEERVLGAEANAIIEAAIDQLPPQGRTIFRLSRDGGMKYREIADHLHISIKTVETHMTRSLVFLRKTVSSQLQLAYAI